MWEKDSQNVRFTQTISSGSKKMDMTSPPVLREDAGVYTCRDTRTMLTTSINIRAGEKDVVSDDVSTGQLSEARHFN